MLERYLLFWVCTLSLIAFYWPWEARDPFWAAKPHLGYLIALTMFSIGWILPRDEVRRVVANWPLVVGGTAVQYLSMPALAYFLGRGFQLEATALLGVVMAGCVPGAMASNVLTLMSKGNISYSLGLTTSATLLSPLLVPIALRLTLGHSVNFPYRSVSSTLCWWVVVPVVSGYFLNQALPHWHSVARKVGATIANLSILIIVATVVAVNRENLVQTSISVFLALVCLNLLGYLAGRLGGVVLRLDEPMRRALTLEVGMQNAGLGATLALSLFPDQQEVAIPAAIYTFGCMFTGTILAQYWAWQPSQDGPKWTC